MPGIVIPGRWGRQPQYAAQTDPAGIDRGLIHTYIPANMRNPTVFGTVNTVVGRAGVGKRQSAGADTTNYFTLPDASVLRSGAGGVQSHIVVVDLPTVASRHLAGKGDFSVATNRTFQVRTDSSGVLQFNGANNDASMTFGSGITLAAGLHVLGVSYAGGTATQNCKFLVNGAVTNAATGPQGALTVNSVAPLKYLAAGATAGLFLGDGSLFAHYWWNRALSVVELLSLSNIVNAWRVYRAPPRRIFFAASGGAALQGDAAGQATATAGLTTQIPLAGAAVIVASASGTIITGIPLAGSAAVASVASGNLTAQITFAASALAQAVAAAGLGTAIPLTGNAAGQAAASGDLSIQIRLNGAAIAQAAASADLTTGGANALAGNAQGNASASATLTTTIPLLGAALSVASANSALTAGITLQGAAAGQASASAALITAIPLAGAAASVATAVGSLDVQLRLAGNALTQALAGGDLTAQITFSASAVAQAAASGALSGAVYQRPPAARLASVLPEQRRLVVLPEQRRLVVLPEQRRLVA